MGCDETEKKEAVVTSGSKKESSAQEPTRDDKRDGRLEAGKQEQTEIRDGLWREESNLLNENRRDGSIGPERKL